MDGSYKLLRWRRRAGDHVAPGDVICDIQSGDTEIEIQAEHYGILQPLVASGYRGKFGDIIGTIDNQIDDSIYEIAVSNAAPKGLRRWFAPLLRRFRKG